jgi:F420-non-reducing hydrogenase small subunit
MMGAKPKVAFYWCASCGGCEETIVDLEEKILDVVAAVDIVFWPCAMDFKYSDVEAMPDKSITVAFINGAIRTDEQKHVAALMRQKSQVVIAFGSCACLGGIPALANLTSAGAIFDRSYRRSPTVENPAGVVPLTSSTVDGVTLELPAFYETVHTLADVIDVDYYLPGCPPTSAVFAQAVGALLEGRLPPKGAVLLPNKALCVSCDRNASKPDTLTITELRRIHQVQADPKTCFLAQGVLCMGPATRDGCDYPCVKGNMPCTGCFGPMEEADQGARMIAAIGGILEVPENDVPAAVGSIPDPAGTFYRYSLSASLLGSRRKEA